MKARSTALFGIAALGLVAFALSAQPEARAQPATDAGLRVERVRLPRAPRVEVGNRTLTVVRVDLRRYRIAVLSAVRDGRPRPLDEWVRDFDLTGGINAGMFLPNRRPVGTLVDRGQVLSDRNPGRFNGTVGWGPRGHGTRIGVGGAGCPIGRDGVLERFSSAVQGFRMMIDCRGRARPWPTRRIYSAAAFGADAQGRAVFVHTRTPYRMDVLNRMMVELDLGIRGLVYMEGGPEASLVVRAPGRDVTEIGSWEDGFNPNDDNRQLWDIPSVIGFRPR